MERDPLRLAWKTAPGRHLVAILLLAVTGLLLMLEIDALRVAIDGTGVTQATLPFGRIAFPLPASMEGDALVLFSGVPLAPAAFHAAALISLAALPALMGFLLLLVDWIAVDIGANVLKTIRTAIVDGMLAASPSAWEDVSSTTFLSSEALVRESDVLSSALLTSLRIGGMIGVSVAYALMTDWQLGAILAVILGLGAVLCSHRLRSRVDAAQARRIEGERAQESLSDLLGRMPALRAHGTETYERERISQRLGGAHKRVRQQERQFAFVDALAPVVLMLAPLGVLCIGLWFMPERPVTTGTLIACTLAAALSATGVRELVQWRRLVDRTHILLTELANSLVSLNPRLDRRAAAPPPHEGAMVAQGVSAYDASSGKRLSGVDLSLEFPAHVALVGDGDSGSRIFAGLVGGRLSPSTGSLTYGGIEIETLDPVARARRIALAGETVLIPGSLRENLLYGSMPDADLDKRLADAIALTGLDELTHAWGLTGLIDGNGDPKLAATIVEARHAVHDALVREGIDHYVDAFDAGRYNRHATIGENILFGRPVGDGFREERLASHPFLRAVLEAGDLTKPLARMGLSVATSMIEIFADVPAGHPLFERFSFFSASDRVYFEDMVARRNEKRRGLDTSADREQLIGLALRYNESRHRLGLMDEGMEGRILTVREDFARMLPSSLRGSIAFYESNALCSAASVQDNLLFGRIATEQAGAEEAVRSVMRRVVTERGLDEDIHRIGLSSPVDARGGDLTLTQIAAVDVVRGLVRQPDILIVERALDGLPGPAAEVMVRNLRRAMTGRGLMIVTPALTPGMEDQPFDVVIRFNRGEPSLDNRVLTEEAVSV